ncbi:hypothetical protein AB1Y20_020646 [Prymnesium parvum]|uniref:Protein OS9-like domain-containing protein n=1 Tax=Prymnesium parvum TaxID=97485 RepID=A0AB34JY11_PRYPA
MRYTVLSYSSAQAKSYCYDIVVGQRVWQNQYVNVASSCSASAFSGGLNSDAVVSLGNSNGTWGENGQSFTGGSYGPGCATSDQLRRATLTTEIVEGSITAVEATVNEPSACTYEIHLRGTVSLLTVPPSFPPSLPWPHGPSPSPQPSPPPSQPSPPLPPAPPTSPALPPPPPTSPAGASPAGAAGNDPIFVGADGIPYRVDGQAGRAFNLISSPCLSVNSEVQKVPPRFQYPQLGLTSTVFGSMHISVGCRNTTKRIGPGLSSNNSQRTRVDARFDVLSGAILCRMPSKGYPEVRCNTVPGLQVVEYYSECDLEDMSCEWFPISAKWSRSLSLAHVQPGITQTRLAIGNSLLVFTRDSLRQGDIVSCDDFWRWPKARKACHLVAQHLSAAGVPQNSVSLSEEVVRRYLAILAAYRGMLVPAHSVFYFFHLAVEHLDEHDFSDPALLHGLLGQRLLSPRPVQNRYSTVIHPDHILKSAGAVNILVSDLGSQGEGFIEGTYHDYMVPSLDNHCAFPFSQFLGDEC